MDLFDDIKRFITDLQSADNTQIVKDSEQVYGTASTKMELPLSKRLSPNNEEAMTQARLEANKHGIPVPSDNGEHDDAIAGKYADEIMEKLLTELE